MKNVLARILLALIALPLLFSCIFLLPHFNHIGIALLTIGASTIGAYELSKLLIKKEIFVSQTISTLTGFIIPTVYWLTGNVDLGPLNLPEYAPRLTIVSLILINLATEIFNTEEKQFKSALTVMSAHLLILLYPAYLSTFVLEIASLEMASFAFLLFFILVFANDTFAYFTGILFGRKTWKPFPISPNKSIVGFIGGFFFTILASYIFFLCKKDLFADNMVYAIILGTIVPFFANIGDLVESAMKRSAETKDSGTIMLGRGGMLDSIDSLVFAAPLYFIFFEYFIQN